MAEETGYSPQTLHDWFSGRARPNLVQLDDLVGYLNRCQTGVAPEEARWSLRWHYALAAIVTAISEVTNPAFAEEVSSLFVTLVNCLGRPSKPEGGPEIERGTCPCRAEHRSDAGDRARRGACPYPSRPRRLERRLAPCGLLVARRPGTGFEACRGKLP